MPLKDFNTIEIESPHTIERISLTHCELERMEGFERFLNLKELDLRNNNISKIENVSNLTNLITLRISYNPISKIENIDTLTSLEDLQLNGCKIQKIEGLDKLNLVELSLIHNQIEKIEGLSHLENLKYLYLDNNQIKKIKGLDKIVKIKRLNLSGNPITEIEGLSFFSSLQDFWCDLVPEFENVEFWEGQREGLIALLRFICMAKIDNPFEVPDITDIITRIPTGFNTLKGSHYAGELIDDRPRPDQELVPYDYENWFFQQAGPRLTKLIQDVLDNPRYQPYVSFDNFKGSIVLNRLQIWEDMLEKSKSYHKN